MLVKATVNGMSVEKNVNNLSEFVDYVKGTMGFELSDIQNIQRID